MLREYLNSIQESINRGDAREESFYAHLEKLIHLFAEGNNLKKIDVTILPKKTEAGNPDFRIWDGKNHITGYIEAKSPETKNLDWIEETGQLQRYRNTFPNVILTNFYEFRLYRDGSLIKKAMIGRFDIARKLQTVPPVENEADFADLLNTFFSYSLPVIRNSKSLALELAKRTRFLRDEVISIEIAEEGKSGKKAILGFYEAFKKYLISTLTEQSFADLYSQTITYGLFAARTRSGDLFNRELAFKYIPNTIGILRDIFRFISLEDPPKPLQIIVDDIAEVLGLTDVKKILQDYYQEGKGKDPIIHFYETFLTAYDPSIREKRGVYYTPEPVVGFIVRSVNQILKSHFEIADGLADEKVTLLDPAGGTLTFPAEAIKLAVGEFTEKYGAGAKSKLIRNHILKNFYAFELMMAPYAIGHLKMSFLFEELGYRLGDDERFKLYLTNTLEMEEMEQSSIPGLKSLSEENFLAGDIKKNKPVLVVLGNPPYSGISNNPGETEILIKVGGRYIAGYFWNQEKGCVDKNLSSPIKKEIRKKQKTFIGDILMDYYFVDGKPLGEKKLWLQDDYVKFLRFAQWKIQQAGYGITAMITNHSYLDNPTFRGMRQSLMNTFNEIYVLDLHGNSLKKEMSPDGSKDENVFDIRQGTAIVILIKQKNIKGCKVFHLDKFGLRKEKYDWLASNEFIPEKYNRLFPESPWYFFIPRQTEKIRDYLGWKAVNEIFPVNVTGIVTARDGFVIDQNKNTLRNRILQLKNSLISDEQLRESFHLKDTRGWKLVEARKKLKQDNEWDSHFKKILYRPFDVRAIYYTPTLIDWGRNELVRHILEPNLSICFMRQFSGSSGYSHFLVSEYMVDNRTFFSSKGIIQQAPLYLYKEKASKRQHFQSMILFEPEAKYDTKDRIPNIDTSFYETLNNAYQKKLSPEEILYYIYAVFYSNVYRKKYSEFLKIDFPRVPFTSDYIIFEKLANLGEELSNLHLMKSRKLDKPTTKYYGDSENDRVEKIAYIEADERIYINKEKYFDKVKPESWDYQIGGYTVLQKYLKDRKGRPLDDPRLFCRIVSAIENTIELQSSIDQLFPELEKDLIPF